MNVTAWVRWKFELDTFNLAANESRMNQMKVAMVEPVPHSHLDEMK